MFYEVDYSLNMRNTNTTSGQYIKTTHTDSTPPVTATTKTKTTTPIYT